MRSAHSLSRLTPVCPSDEALCRGIQDQLPLDVPTRKTEDAAYDWKRKLSAKEPLSFHTCPPLPQSTCLKASSTNGIFRVIAHTAYSDLPFLPATGIA